MRTPWCDRKRRDAAAWFAVQRHVRIQLFLRHDTRAAESHFGCSLVCSGNAPTERQPSLIHARSAQFARTGYDARWLRRTVSVCAAFGDAGGGGMISSSCIGKRMISTSEDADARCCRGVRLEQLGRPWRNKRSRGEMSAAVAGHHLGPCDDR